MAKRPGARRIARPAGDRPDLWVAAALPGGEDLLKGEIERRFKGQVSFLPHGRNSECHFRYQGKPKALLSLQLCQSLYLRRDFQVTRPRTLLSPEHLAHLARDLSSVRSITPKERFTGLRWDAAGSGSPTMLRLGHSLAEQLDLPFQNDTGDLVVTLRPGDDGWEALYRVGSRPLGTRAWRRVNYRGSLNATVAAALVELTEPSPHDSFLNLMCGSGTIMIERLQRSGARIVVGVDQSDIALSAAAQNCAGAGVRERIMLLKGDATRLPFEDGSFDQLCVDLPWGESMGSRESNEALYRATFEESHRLCRPGGRLVVLSQDQRALEAVATNTAGSWQLIGQRSFEQRGFRPECRVYRRGG